MPRSRAPSAGINPFHVHARCVNREAFPLPMPTIWSVMEDYLYLLANGFGLSTHAFVLMPNHFHLIASSNEDVGEAMEYFMRETSKEIGRLSGRINQLYGGPHGRSVLTSNHYLKTAYKYVYRNPVKAGLSKTCESYRYSTLAGLTGQTRLIVPVHEDPFLFDGSLDSTLRWLNQQPTSEAQELVRKALKRRTFKLPRSPNGRQCILESELF